MNYIIQLVDILIKDYLHRTNIEKYVILLFVGLLIILLIGSVINAKNTTSSISKDDTDPPDGKSGMAILTDYRTGCQYLVTGPYTGGITPRMNPDGTQICNK